MLKLKKIIPAPKGYTTVRPRPDDSYIFHLIYWTEWKQQPPSKRPSETFIINRLFIELTLVFNYCNERYWAITSHIRFKRLNHLLKPQHSFVLNVNKQTVTGILIWVILDCLACTMHFVKLIVVLFFTVVYHFEFVPHTITTVYLNFIVCMLIYFYHSHMSSHYV